ncbi:MAG TPA: methyltransferase domain-containing protein [Ktedonobacterales bacterium]
MSRQQSLGPVVRVEHGRKVLRVGGVIQSVHVDDAHVPDVWDAMLPDIRPARALILGLGGGTMAQLLTRRYGDVPVIGVERDATVAALARDEFGLGAQPHVRIMVADALAWVRTERATYDCILVDLFTAGKMAHGVLGERFLRDVARLLAPEGTASFNLWRSAYLDDALRRLGRVFTIHERLDVDQNVIVRAGHGELAA